jgi:hypothetical protein
MRKHILSDEQLATLIFHLRILIAAAPAGPWNYAESSGYNNPSVRAPDGPLFSTGNSPIARASRVAAAHYAAAISPDVLAALLDTIEQTVDERDVLAAGIDAMSAAVEQLSVSSDQLHKTITKSA